jgi:UDP-N-acetylmuramate--alanine ligase
VRPDETIVPDIYFVRDSEAERQSRARRGPRQPRSRQTARRRFICRHFGSIVGYLKDAVREGDLVVTMGAGNVWQIGLELVG